MDILENMVSAFSASQLCMGIVLLGASPSTSAWHFFLHVLLAGLEAKPWIKEGECESDPGTGSSGHL